MNVLGGLCLAIAAVCFVRYSHAIFTVPPVMFANETLAVQTKCQPHAPHELSGMVVIVLHCKVAPSLPSKHHPGQRHARSRNISNPPAYFCAAHPAAILDSER